MHNRQVSDSDAAMIRSPKMSKLTDETTLDEPPPPPQSPSSESRTDERAAITLRVDYKRLNTFFADYTKNISKGGTFIRTTKPLDIGTEFVFVLSFPAQKEQLNLLGEVVWVTAEKDASEEKPAGMGIRFKFKNDEERDLVSSFVEKLMTDALGSHISERLLRKV
jgi:type IV pilus assembly protein PilZ